MKWSVPCREWSWVNEASTLARVPNVDYSEPGDLFTQQARNRRRAAWLIAAFVLFFAWLGFGGDYIAYLATRDAAGDAASGYRHVIPWFGIALTAFGAGLAAYAWRGGPHQVLRSANAREVIDSDVPVERQFVNVVHEMAIASGVPPPRTWIIDDPDPNAFATGRHAREAHIAVTDGLLLTLGREELQAVVAHEIGHIKNLDVRLMTLLAALVGAVALLSDGLWRGIFRSGRVRGGRMSGGKKGGNPVVIVLLVVWALSWLLAPIITRMLALGVSRQREYLADALGAQFTRNPLALASALEKIEQMAEPTRRIKRGTAHLCIADPLGRPVNDREGLFAGWFGTHPPMALRVARLKAMGYRARKAEPAGATA
ncbi:MAG: M48 family metallopeptidase [Gemmatimonadaceae bacterium]